MALGFENVACVNRQNSSCVKLPVTFHFANMLRLIVKGSAGIIVPKDLLMNLRLFKNNPGLLKGESYVVKAYVDRPVLDFFMVRLCGHTSSDKVTKENVNQLRALCDELGFSGFDDEIRAVLDADDSTSRIDMLHLRGRVDRHDILLERLQRQVFELERRIQRQDEFVTHEALEQRLSETDRAVQQEIDNIDVRNEVRELKNEISNMPSSKDLETIMANFSRFRETVAARNELQVFKKDVQRAHNKAGDAMSDARRCKEDLRNLQCEVNKLKLYLEHQNELNIVEGPVAQPVEQPIDGPVERKSSKKTAVSKKTQCLTVIEDGNAFRYDKTMPLTGIIAHLTNECGGNVHDKGVMEVTVSGFGHMQWCPKNVVDLQSETYFFSTNAPNSWLCYDFKEKRVSPTSYSITSYPFGPGMRHLRSWVLEVSNDKRDWQVADRRENNSDLNDMKVTHNFSITKKLSGSFRFIRVRLTGHNHKNNDILSMSSLEVFGKLFEK